MRNKAGGGGENLLGSFGLRNRVLGGKERGWIGGGAFKIRRLLGSNFEGKEREGR